MQETAFKPALWHNSLENLQKAIHYIEYDGDEEVVEDTLVGLLTFKDGLSLVLDIPYGKIIGEKTIGTENGFRIFAGEYDDINSVFGYSQNGKWYVLSDVFVRSSHVSAPGFSSQIIQGHYLIVSNKPIPDNPLIDRISLSHDGFTKWFRYFNITRKYEANIDEEGKSSGCKKIAFEYEPPDNLILYRNDDLTISVEQTGTEAGGPIINAEASLSVSSKLVIKYSCPTKLEKVIQTSVNQLRELLSLFSGVFCTIESIQASLSSKKQNLDYYAPFVKREYPITDDEVLHIPFPYPEIENRISSIIDKWLNLSPDATNAVSILVSRLDKSVMSCDLAFIACASAFEALSRVDAEQERFEQEHFKTCIDSALNSIEDRDFKEWLENVVVNRRSAGSLAKELVKKIQPLSSYILPDINKFLYDHRICRNAYVHRDGLEDNSVLKNEELFIHTNAVWLLCYGAILDLIGITPEETLEALKRSYYQAGIISQIRQQYAR